MRLGLSERVAIEAGIYRRDSLEKIAKDIGISRKSLSKEIRQNRTFAPAAKFNGKDCRFAAECTRQCVCGDVFCRRECVFCRKIDCSTLCSAYAPLSCKKIESSPYSLIDTAIPRKPVAYSYSWMIWYTARAAPLPSSSYHITWMIMEKLSIWNFVTILVIASLVSLCALQVTLIEMPRGWLAICLHLMVQWISMPLYR